MKPLTITWMYHADDIESSLRINAGRDAQFVLEVARHTGVAIPLVERKLCEAAPAEGFVLWNVHGLDPSYGLRECSERVAELAPRLVALDASTSRIFRLLELMHMAAAIDPISHLVWKNANKDDNRPQGLYGQREIAARIGARCADKGGSENYCYLTSANGEGLPKLLADYLIALHQTQRE
jgi:hypothetical protein